MMVAARVDVGWIAVESEKASTRLLKILRIVAMKRIFRMEKMIMNAPVDLAGQAEMGLCATPRARVESTSPVSHC